MDSLIIIAIIMGTLASPLVFFIEPNKYVSPRKIFNVSRVYGNKIKINEDSHIEIKEITGDTDARKLGLGLDISISFVYKGIILETIDDYYFIDKKGVFRGPWKREIKKKIKELDKEIKLTKRMLNLEKKNKEKMIKRNNVEFYKQKRAD